MLLDRSPRQSPKSPGGKGKEPDPTPPVKVKKTVRFAEEAKVIGFSKSESPRAAKIDARGETLRKRNQALFNPIAKKLDAVYNKTKLTDGQVQNKLQAYLAKIDEDPGRHHLGKWAREYLIKLYQEDPKAPAAWLSALRPPPQVSAPEASQNSRIPPDPRDPGALEQPQRGREAFGSPAAGRSRTYL